MVYIEELTIYQDIFDDNLIMKPSIDAQKLNLNAIKIFVVQQTQTIA